MSRATAWLGVLLGLWCAGLAGCNNNPMPGAVAASNTLVSAMIEGSPRHLDPVASYWSNDTPFTYQIYEPPYAYHYLLRPFQLRAKTALDVARPTYLDRDGRVLADDAPGAQVAESVYDIRIAPGIRYQPHPAFAADDAGRLLYHALTPADLENKRSPGDFPKTGTREHLFECLGILAADAVFGAPNAVDNSGNVEVSVQSRPFSWK